MKQLIDLLPGLIFLAVYFYTKNFMLATTALLISSALQLLLQWILHRKVDKMQWIIFLLLLPTALLTLIFHNPLFLKWKPSIINWVFAGIIWGGYFIKQKNFTRTLLESMTAHLPDLRLNPPDLIWQRANHGVAWAFTLEGLLNIAVAYGASTSTWVLFKIGGILVLNTLGLILLFAYLFKHRRE